MYKKKILRDPAATWNTCTEGNKCNSCDGIFQSDSAAKMACNVANDSCEGTNPYNGYNEGKPAIQSI